MNFLNHVSSFGSSVFIANLPKQINRKEIQNIFEEFGKVNNIFLRWDGKYRFGIILFEETKSADEAMRHLHGRKQNKKEILYNYAINSSNKILQINT